MTHVVRVDPSGEVTRCDGADFLALANEWFGGQIDVFSLQPIEGAPPELPQAGGYLVGACAEWGRMEGAKVNPKAWALYGRSPLVGVVFLAFDSDDDGHRDELPEQFVEQLATDWVRPPLMRVDAMRHIAAQNGCEWPT